MAYASRRSSRRSYRPRRRTAGKTRSRRTYRKTARRPNNSNYLTMGAKIASRLLNVKLPWLSSFANIFADLNAIPANGMNYAFGGNSMVPYCHTAQTGPAAFPIATAGDVMPAGMLEYSNLYDRAAVYGSKINISFINTGGSADQFWRVILLSVPYNSGVGVNPEADDWHSVKAQLDSYGYRDLISWPGAINKVCGFGGAGRTSVSAYCSTKKKCGIKDVRDNMTYQCPLNDGKQVINNGLAQPNDGFMWYLRIQPVNPVGGDSGSYEFTVKMTQYCGLSNREFTKNTTITSDL